MNRNKKNKRTYKKKINQPVFYYKNEKQSEIKAGGVVFYYYDRKNNELKFLLIKNREKYEDFGGKTDPLDKTIEETIAREVEEESNEIFTKTNIIKRIENKNPLYTKNSKYLLYFCRLKSSENYNPSIFGTKEIYENIPRTVEWISYDKLKNSSFIKKNLSYRLRFRTFFTKINKLHTFYKNKYTPNKKTIQSIRE
jgi:hypothetical protein